ncbi:MAG: RhuM family protein [Bacteroidales bacterium]|nr:RhuM family protein [Bacteroidales bacterium]MDD6622994.1 RhuM family protein [Bacteroidales bacterium]
MVCAKFAHMGIDQDQTYETKMYSLDVIISVGYRFKSIKQTKFKDMVKFVVNLINSDNQ